MKTEDQRKKSAEAAARYRERHKEKVKAYDKLYKKKHELRISEYNQEWREANPDYYKEWYWSNEKARVKKSASHKKWLDENKAKQIEASKIHAIRHPEKFKARNALRRAVYEGKIIKPSTCQVCVKSVKRIEGHHEDYEKPLDVIWMCVACHRKHHKSLEVDLGSQDI